MDEPKYHLSQVIRSREETLTDFDGPLDLILELLSKNKIAIEDLSISTISEQYLAYLDEMKRMDMEIASEFITMASYLMLIKTKMLLSFAEREEALSEMELLIRSLEDRQRKAAFEQIRIAVGILEPRSELGTGYFPKQPEPLRKVGGYSYQHEPEDLVRAYALLQDRAERMLPPPTTALQAVMVQEPYSISKKTAEILHRLISGGVRRLRELFSGAKSRSELVATFLAVLELCRLNSIELGDADVRFVKMPDEMPEES